jgi:hypothetical protein
LYFLPKRWLKHLGTYYKHTLTHTHIHIHKPETLSDEVDKWNLCCFVALGCLLLLISSHHFPLINANWSAGLAWVGLVDLDSKIPFISRVSISRNGYQ